MRALTVLSLLISWECEFCDGFRNVIRQSAGLKVKRAQFNELIKILCKEVPAQSQHLGRKNIKLGNFDKSDLILTESTSLGKAVYSHEDWAQQYVSVGGEFSYWIDNIEGNVPSDLVGSLFRNGPARFERGGQKYASLLDGDGYISRFTFLENQTCHYAGRFIRTREFLEEESAGKICHRGAFGTQVSALSVHRFLAGRHNLWKNFSPSSDPDHHNHAHARCRASASAARTARRRPASAAEARRRARQRAGPADQESG